MRVWKINEKSLKLIENKLRMGKISESHFTQGDLREANTNQMKKHIFVHFEVEIICCNEL